MKRNVEARRARKAQVLGDSNVSESFRSNSSDEEVVKRNRLVQRRKSVIEMEKQQQRLEEEGEEVENGRRKRKSDVSGLDQSGEEDAGQSSDSENNARVQQKTKRIRRRLSKRMDELQKLNRSASAADLNMSYGNLNVSSSHSAEPGRPATDKKTLQEIYSTCSALFQAHKITPQNAFSLKLVECLDEIIESDDFDRKNLPLLARTLEIGGKIYVCRVDHTHAHTIKLATEIAQNQNEQAGDAEGEGPQDENDDPHQAEGHEERKKKARTKKRSRFIEENEAKLNTGFEDQSSKYATRRASLKLKLHRNIDEELDFDYLSYFLKPGESNPLEREEEFRGLSSEAIIPESHANADEMKEIPWLPFHSLTEWDPAKFDFWGVPLSADPMDISDLQRPFEPPVIEAADENEFAYNPDNRPDEYPVENDAESFGGPDGDFGDDNFDDGPARPEGVGPLALDNLRSLDDLHKFFASLKGNQMSMKNKYGWAGPVFLKPQRTALKKHIDGKSKKQPRKKKMMLLDFDEVDWKDPANRYVDGGLSKTTIDDKTLDKWASSKTTAPFCNPLNFMNYDEDEEEFRAPFDLPDGTDDFMANVTRFFVDSNKTIFKLMEDEFKMGKDVLSQSHMGPAGMAQPFDDDDLPEPDMDIEAARDFADDSNGDIMPVPDAEPGPGLFDDFAAAGFNFSSMFPGSQGFDTDPFSRASEFDSIKFSKQPKPIDMHALKRFIRVILAEKLEIGDEGKPLREEETRMDLLTLLSELMKRVSKRMAKHLSVAIVVVGLMHVVHDNKLFMVKDTHTDSLTLSAAGPYGSIRTIFLSVHLKISTSSSDDFMLTCLNSFL